MDSPRKSRSNKIKSSHLLRSFNGSNVSNQKSVCSSSDQEDALIQKKVSFHRTDAQNTQNSIINFKPCHKRISTLPAILEQHLQKNKMLKRMLTKKRKKMSSKGQEVKQCQMGGKEESEVMLKKLFKRKKYVEIDISRELVMPWKNVKSSSNRKMSYMDAFDRRLNNIKLAEKLLYIKPAKELQKKEHHKFYSRHLQHLQMLTHVNEEVMNCVIYVRPKKKYLSLDHQKYHVQ